MEEERSLSATTATAAASEAGTESSSRVEEGICTIANSVSSVAEDTVAEPKQPKASARPRPSFKRTKGRGKSKAKEKQPRLKWTNDMVSKLLELRFMKDGEVKRKIEMADTNVKKALAWQYFATVLSEELHTVVTSEQLTSKYRKMKCEYRTRKRDLQATGNNPLEPMDDAYWDILNDAFVPHTGISGEVIFDSNLDDAPTEEGEDLDEEETSTSRDEKKPPIVQLATAMQAGMEAIASSMSASSGKDGKLESLIEILNAQHDETRRFQEQQIELLKLLASKLH